jgi:hypothetical protein
MLRAGRCSENRVMQGAAVTFAAKSARIGQMFRRLADRMFDPYRPELHYMRGPGPKWRAKHGQAASPAEIDALALALRKVGA